MIYVKARVLQALLGRSDTDQVRIDAKTFGWRSFFRVGSNGRYFALADAERTYRREWSDAQVFAAIDRYSDPAAVDLPEEGAGHAAL